MRYKGMMALIPLGVVLVGGGAAAAFWPRSVEQPIAFSHQKHVGDMGLDCTICHLYAETGVRATIPNVHVCEMCHAAPLTDSPEEALLVEFIESREPIPWRKVYWTADHVFFSHRRHTAIAEIPCETCHGAVGGMSTPISTQLVEITMDRCVQCHRLESASTDCITCHR